VVTGLGPESANIRSLTDRIGPHVAPLARGVQGRGALSAELVREAVRANVRAAVDHLRHGSRLLEDLVLAGELEVIGAEYELETGTVLFLDEPRA
jgi:carbonic anhydrase